MMKWWGWGHPDRSFPMQDKPTLWPWVCSKLNLSGDGTITHPIEFSKISIPAAIQNTHFMQELKALLRPEQMSTDPLERVQHSYGKSFPDLLAVRKGHIHRAPDLVLLPDSHEDVAHIVHLAHRHNVGLIPFGGGTNIVGGVNPMPGEERMMVSLDMRNMNRLLAVDPESRTARIQAGALGPKLEEDLAAVGFNLGHYPDSFEYSSLGGWIATRSAGMQSDAYGKIEDMVVSLKMITPSGEIVTRDVPASSAGPDLNRMILGSEGILGVITEATMRVHKSPPKKDYRGFLFKSFEDGVKAIQDCIDQNFAPSMIRLQDEGETELAFNMKSPKKGIEASVQKIVKMYLKRAGYKTPCIMIVGFEGDETSIKYTRKMALKIIAQHGGFSLGSSVGKTWSKDKFNVPYLRDYIMDYGCMADVAETATIWSKVLPLYRDTIQVMKARFAEEGNGYIGCHISHTYKTGACLYFTYATQQPKENQLEHYYGYKRAITDAIVNAGGTVSHHHAIGIEHLPWMTKEISPAGLQALRAMKTSLDPKGIFNPGKLLPKSNTVDAKHSADGHRASDLLSASV